MRIIAGCDGGGTKCEVHVAAYDDAGQRSRWGRAVGGSANVEIDPDLASHSILTTTRIALHQAELPADSKIDSFVAALAGAGSVESQHLWEHRLAQSMNVSQVRVLPDAAILFAAADVSGAAVAATIGTGSIAWARSDDGRQSRAGGLGPFLGDEGSAFWIGREAIKSLLRGELSRPLQTTLLERESVQQIQRTQSENDRGSIPQQSIFPDLMSQSDLAALSPIVFEFAEADLVAANILQRAAYHLATLVYSASAPVLPDVQVPLPWICAGGVAKNQPAFLAQIRNAVLEMGVHLSFPVIVDQPATGALKLARKYDSGLGFEDQRSPDAD